MAWPTVAEVETYLSSPGMDEAALTLGIDLAKAAIRNYIGQYLDLVTDDEVQVFGPIGRYLFLPEAPIVDVTSVELNAGTTYSTAYVATDWVIDANQAALVRAGDYYVWTTNPADLATVVYTHGYADIPDDIRLVALTSIARWSGNPGGVVSETVGQYSVSYSQGQPNQGAGLFLLADEKAILDKYRLVTVR